MKPGLRRAVAIVVLAILANAHDGLAQPSEGTPRPLRVLFIGNSYTYFNNLPEIVQQLGKSARPSIAIDVKRVVQPGSTLQRHWSRGDALVAVRGAKWDYVVLQDQSTLGSRFINGELVIDDPANFHKYARMFVKEIRATGAQPVFLATWARRRVPYERVALAQAYTTIARELNARVIPAGDAWAQSMKVAPGIDLYFSDGGHPGPKGSYLTGCLALAVLTGRSTSSLAPVITVGAIDEPAGVDIPGRSQTITVPEAEAKLLQRIAQEAADQLTHASESSPAFPRAPVLPVVPEGRSYDVAALNGTWGGPLRISGTSGTIEISFKVSDAASEASYRLIFPDGSIGAGAVRDLVADGKSIALSIVNEPYPIRTNEGTFRFRGVMTQYGPRGVMEFTRGEFSLALWDTLFVRQ